MPNCTSTEAVISVPKKKNLVLQRHQSCSMLKILGRHYHKNEGTEITLMVSRVLSSWWTLSTYGIYVYLASLLGKSHGQRSLVGCSTWSHKKVGHNLVTKQQQNYSKVLHNAKLTSENFVSEIYTSVQQHFPSPALLANRNLVSLRHEVSKCLGIMD